MKDRFDILLLAMIALQLVHAVEEFVLEFWNAFPPMRAVYGGVPGLGPRVFVLFHSLLILFGLWCYREMRRGRIPPRAAIGAWILIQGVTLFVHVAWFVVDSSYQPGLATTPLFAATIAAAILVLKREPVANGRGDD
ncbi:MAG: HXXEE domain-containing protein [Candidatus Latescibacteria bacterium]|nr:HXXEE domain-containing protein [Candidatus Latescibacterota bacterium]